MIFIFQNYLDQNILDSLREECDLFYNKSVDHSDLGLSIDLFENQNIFENHPGFIAFIFIQFIL
jgi:hypothetical protein